jgi:uncharacterized protein (AIM24 family)
MIEEFLKSQVGIVMISIIWGLGVASLFQRSCEGSGCKVVEFRGPPVETIKKYKWVYDPTTKVKKCHSVQPYISSCQT